jgi:ComF family protein
VRGFLSFLIDLLCPFFCVHCGSGLLEGPSRVGATMPKGWPAWAVSFFHAECDQHVLCRDCWFQLEPAFSEGALRAEWLGNTRVRLITPFYTNEVLLALVRFLKFGGGTPAAGPLSWWMARTLEYCCPELSAEGIVVPVPLHRGRELHRGYNQAALLAKGVASFLGLHYCGRALVRCRRTKSQAKLGDEARARNVRYAFLLTEAPAVAGKDIVLVDDLVTSGETVRWCAEALLSGGVRRLIVLAAGRRKRQPDQAFSAGPGSP